MTKNKDEDDYVRQQRKPLRWKKKPPEEPGTYVYKSLEIQLYTVAHDPFTCELKAIGQLDHAVVLLDQMPAGKWLGPL